MDPETPHGRDDSSPLSWRRFKTPRELVVATDLTEVEKVRALESWEYDCRQLEVAEEENMGGGEVSQLELVLEALRAIRSATEPRSVGPGKHGGRGSTPSGMAETLDAPRDVDSAGVYDGLSLADLGYENLVARSGREEDEVQATLREK
jgi:hypothetical protein